MMLLVTSIILLLCFSAFFSGTETAVMALDRYQLKTLAEEGDTHAQRLLDYLEDPERFFSVVLLGNTFANLACASLFTLWIVDYFGESSVALGTVLLTLWVLLFCELLPKSLAARYALPISMVVVNIIAFIELLLAPALFGVHKVTRFLTPGKKSQGLSMQDLRRVIRAASSHLSDSEQDMLEGVLDLSALSVEHVMQPKHMVNVITKHASLAEIKGKLSEANSHYLVMVSDIKWTDVLGVLYAKDILGELESFDHLKKQLKPIGYVQEGTPLNRQLSNFKKRRQEVSIVVDEYGEILGVVDVHDIVEEVVGYYANRRAVPIGSVRFDGAQGYWVRADVTVRDLNRYLDWDLPEMFAKSVGGLALHELKSIPDGECSIIIGQYLVTLVSFRGNRLILFHISEILSQDE